MKEDLYFIQAFIEEASSAVFQFGTIEFGTD